MDRLRSPFLVVAIVLAVLVLLVETGSGLARPEPVAAAQVAALLEGREGAEDVEVHAARPGPSTGIREMAVLDGLVAFTLGLMGASLLYPERVHGRIQGLASLVAAIVALLTCLAWGLATFAELMVMVSLFLAAPFGTLAYLAGWGFFDRGTAAGLLSLLLTLKVAGCVCLVLAHPRNLQNKGLVLIVLTGLLANVVVGLLHGLVPVVLVSITDAVAGLVGLVLGAIWAVALLVGAIVSLVKLARLTRTG